VPLKAVVPPALDFVAALPDSASPLHATPAAVARPITANILT
jgi:hypothetical protein